MSLPQIPPPASRWPSAIAALRLPAHQRLDTLLDFCLADGPARGSLASEDALHGLLLSRGQVLVQLLLRDRHERSDLTAWLARGYHLSDADAPRTSRRPSAPSRTVVPTWCPKAAPGGIPWTRPRA